MNFSILDFVIFGSYCFVILFVGLFVSRKKEGHIRNAEDYFLAGKSLSWWAIGASLIAANISAEQFIGMSGSGYAIGLAIASYEWMAAITLLVVGKFFLPIFIEKRIYTIPEFVEKRFSAELKTILAVFWIGLYVFVNLSSVLYLGALALQATFGIDLVYSILGLAIFAAAYSLYGGLLAVAVTDIIQVIFLLVGGLITTYLALDIVSGGAGMLTGFQKILDKAPEKFHMILEESDPAYQSLPGIWVLIGGLWVANLYYWGFNQYIIQRTLAAKSLAEAQKGIAFAAGLKLIIPFIVVIPGIAAYVIVNDAELLSSLNYQVSNVPTSAQPDKAYPWLLQLLPTGLKGVALAALAAAVVSSLASMLNSTSTIFTMDIYRPYLNQSASQYDLVRTGRITSVVALIVSCIIAPFLGGIGQAFQFIQEYTGLVSPGILAVFLMGLFWRRATNRAASIGAVLSVPIAIALKWVPGVPFMNQWGIAALATMLIVLVISHVENKGEADKKGIMFRKLMFRTTAEFNICAFAICILTAMLYAFFW